MRYFRVFLLLCFVGVACLIAQWAFVAAGLDYALTARSGVGQLTLFVIVLSSILWFSRNVAGVPPRIFALRYAADWRRVLLGFAVLWGFTTLVILAGFMLTATMGKVQWSEAAWQALTPKVAWKTVVAMVVALILATTEEFIFRGFLLRYFRYNDTFRVTIGAVVGSAAIFSLSHLIALPGAWHDPERIPLLFGLFLIGILTGTAYVATGSIAASIGVHFGLLGFKVFLRKTHLVAVSPGDSWWLGGSTDLRVAPLSWVVLLLMVGAIILCRRSLWKRFWVETVVSRPAANRIDAQQSPAKLSDVVLGFRKESEAPKAGLA